MNYLSALRELAEDCYFVVWKDPSEGDGTWKEDFDGKASVNVNVGWMIDNPNDPDEFVLFCSRSMLNEDKEVGSEIYIPKGCVQERYKITVTGERDVFETTTTSRRTN